MTVINVSPKWAGCRATKGVSGSGKYFFECRVLSANNGICRVGWSTLNDSLDLGASKTSGCVFRDSQSRLRFWRHGHEGDSG